MGVVETGVAEHSLTVEDQLFILTQVVIGDALSGAATATLHYIGANRGRFAYRAPVIRPGVDCTS